MTIEQANIILRARDDMNGNEIALLTLIMDLQVRHVEMLERLERVERRAERLAEGTGDWRNDR